MSPIPLPPPIVQAHKFTPHPYRPQRSVRPSRAFQVLLLTAGRAQLFLTAGLALILLTGCASPQASPPAIPAGAQPGQLTPMEACEYQPLDGKTRYAAECGTLYVPERWDVPGSRLLAQPVVRIPARSPAPAEAVFYLQGGPGQSNFSWAPPDWLLAEHDLIFVGYRGVDGSVSLACPQFSRAFKAHVGEDLFSAAASADYKAAVKQCAASHQSAGVDLAGYTIPNVIADLEAARTALGYDRVNLLSESYGTRVAQLYAYLHPQSLHRLVLVGVNTPGRFVWEPAALDRLIRRISELCAQDAACSSRTNDLAQTVFEVNRNMPKRWLVFGIDPDTVRLGSNFMLLNNRDMAMIFDSYLAAQAGDPSGLALLNLMTSFAPIDQQVFGDLVTKAGTVDLETYRGIEAVGLDDSIIGAPMTEYIWPLAVEWPLELVPEELRQIQESDVEMLLVNGALDFSTPYTALAEAAPYYHRAQNVLLPEFGHISDVMTLQPEAFERLVTSYYQTGVGDASLFVYEPLSFTPDLRLSVLAKLSVAAVIILSGMLFLGVGLVARRIRRRQARQTIPLPQPVDRSLGEQAAD